MTLPSPLPQHLFILKVCAVSLAVDTFSACLRNGVPKRAIELLEQGRSISWNQLTCLRPPPGDVIPCGPAGQTLANAFTHLTTLIHKAFDSPEIDQHGRIYHLNLEMQKAMTAIHELP